MEIALEFVVKDINKSAEFYVKYFGFEIEIEEYEPTAWMQLRKGNTILMLVTYDFTKKDIEGFKEYTPSTNLYKFCYDSLDEVKELYNVLKNENVKFFLDFREADYRYEFGIYDLDNNMILITKLKDLS